MKRYFAELGAGRLLLWSYFIWYLVVAVRYFDPAPRLWLTSLGISALVGTALYVSTAGCGKDSVKLQFWQIVRLYLTPFCVSSFSALVKDRNFILVFSPDPADTITAVSMIGALLVMALTARKSSTPDL